MLKNDELQSIDEKCTKKKDAPKSKTNRVRPVSAFKIAVGFVIMSERGLFRALLLREITLSTFSFRVPFDLDYR